MFVGYHSRVHLCFDTSFPDIAILITALKLKKRLCFCRFIQLGVDVDLSRVWGKDMSYDRCYCHPFLRVVQRICTYWYPSLLGKKCFFRSMNSFRKPISIWIHFFEKMSKAILAKLKTETCYFDWGKNIIRLSLRIMVSQLRSLPMCGTRS